MSQRARAAGVTLAVVLTSSSFAVQAQEPSALCTTGLVLGVTDSAAIDVVAAFCRPARARGVVGRLRVSVVAVGTGITVTVTRIDITTGIEESVRLQSRTIEEAIRDAPQLVATLQGNPPTRTATTTTTTPPPPEDSVGKAAPPDPSANQVSASAPESSSSGDPVGATATIKIRSPTRVQLQRLATAGWETACMSPCDRELPVNDEYRVVDNNGRPLRSFRLEGRAAVATIEVWPRNLAIDIIGTTGIILGTFLLYGGAVANASHKGGGTPLIAAGLTGIFVGPTMLLLNKSGSSIKEGQDSSSSSSSSSSDSSPHRSLLPTVAESTVRELVGPRGAVMSAPIVSFAF